MNSGVISASSTLTKIKLPKALARKSAFAGAGDTRYASSTWLRSSPAQVWFSATTAANRNATHTSPPAIGRDSSAVGLKEKLKITTTNSAKNNIELMASFDRHSSRKSLLRVAAAMPGSMLIAPPRCRYGDERLRTSLEAAAAAALASDQRSALPASTRIRRRCLRATALGV